MDLSSARGHWVDAATIVWDRVSAVPAGRFLLCHSADAGIQIRENRITAGTCLDLTPGEPYGERGAIGFPHLAGKPILQIPATNRPGPNHLGPSRKDLRELLRGQTLLAAIDSTGSVYAATSLQTPGVLDDLFPYDGPLGPQYDADRLELRLWAPTARSVTLLLFDDADPATTPTAHPMDRDPPSGVWSIAGELGWDRRYYLYEIVVYVPATGRMEINRVTDPYAVSLSANSERSQLVDLFGDARLQPPAWDTHVVRELHAPEDAVIYELHVRDFSIYDLSVRPEYRGRFLAFTEPSSDSFGHLKMLAEAGLSHVHLLPIFDFATVEETHANRREPDRDMLGQFESASPEPQKQIAKVRQQDGYNWGYDPYHYGVPEGSYATEPNGPARIFEFRSMVRNLHAADLRVVIDVVYNHTSARGQHPRSVLDRIVPGYYHRLEENGAVSTSTCCQNTASEHRMMRKLMVDTVVRWATAYRVDGFRFDLMGHHMVADMQAVRVALDALTLEHDGVDGGSVYVYGEGWDFGEVAGGARGVNASQHNMTGSGIGTFNDRLRDGVRGGGPFSPKQERGFATGLFDGEAMPDEQAAAALNSIDWIRVGLAGNLADFEFIGASGRRLSGFEVDYKGSGTGYTSDPQENVVYVSAHDNETLWDAIAYKAADSLSVPGRIRMQNLAVSIAALSQGVPLFHAGVEILRSKSLDRDSFDSGDWFNHLDFTYESNNWGVGLPPEWANGADWDVMRSLLNRSSLKPRPEHIRGSLAHFVEMLRIRRSSPLFRLRVADEIHARLAFHNTGPSQLPGLIAMTIQDTAGVDLDPERELVAVLFNSRQEDVRFEIRGLRGRAFALHRVLKESSDPRVRRSSYESGRGRFHVPGRTTAVFVAR